jgi:hypothetical protein
MDDPIKIIHKFKNNNRRVQYYVHIFIGDIVEPSCMKVLNKIKDLDLFASLTSIDARESEILVNAYGDYWYTKFFNTYHINDSKASTVKNPQKMKQLTELYGKKWVDEHFVAYLKKKVTLQYSYEAAIKADRRKRNLKKIINKQKEEAEDEIDYTTTNIGLSGGVPDFAFEQVEYFSGGASIEEADGEDDFNTDDDQTTEEEFYKEEDLPEFSSDEDSEQETIEEYDDFEDMDKTVTELEALKAYDQTPEFLRGGSEAIDLFEFEKTLWNSKPLIASSKLKGGLQGLDEEMAADFSLEHETYLDAENSAFDKEVENDLLDLDLLYGDIDEVDANIKQTTRDIKSAIGNEAYDKMSKVSEFDTGKDYVMFDESLKNVFAKNYIVHQYIYKDDTIKTIKNKICAGFKNDPKFGENMYMLPVYQYLWSEYVYADPDTDNVQLRKAMLGQKWVVKSDLLKIDVEPNNNLLVYQELRGNIRLLRDNIRRQGKVKREDDESNILHDYDNYYTNNEIFMVDIFNELGLDFEASYDELRNLSDVYIKIYFPKLKPDDILAIIMILNTRASDSSKNQEYDKIKLTFNTINNDLITENDIMRDVELVKKKHTSAFTKMFKENYVNQTVVRAFLISHNSRKLDLFRIFTNFVLDNEYPFAQYRPADGIPRIKFAKEHILASTQKNTIYKWIENSPYGISFKIRVDDDSLKGSSDENKFVGVNLSETGRVDYKIQWKEEDQSTIDDIIKTYKYVRKLVQKINDENFRYHINLLVPSDDMFDFAFISTIQKFELPNNFVIDHNDFSEFSRYFYPYVALVIEPRKRLSKKATDGANDKSKYGTYLRYKRVSKYENKTKIEHRIVFFMRNYEYNDQSLSNEISKEFNITEEQALAEIIAIREKYPNIKPAKKVLRKLENIPKYKPPGIGIDIQGKTRNRYKIRIAGARSKEQLDRIVTFMHILVYLYVETYLYAKPERQKMKERLKRLTNIARRRNKVDEVVYHDVDSSNLKQIAQIDKLRFGNMENENWARQCQNSGNSTRRRPLPVLDVEELLKMGYVWKEKLDDINFGHYAREVTVDVDGKKQKVSLRAIQLPLDETGDTHIFYTCSPEENGKHIFLDFLSKARDAPPCCFIKDHFYSQNPEKRNAFLQSLGISTEDGDGNRLVGDQLYILQNTNKLQAGRLAFLPKHLDIYLNYMMGKNIYIKNNYLDSSESGYYFKYGVDQDEHGYLNAVSDVFGLNITQLKDRMIKILTEDKTLAIFTSLNNGDIRTRFQTVDAYIYHIKTSTYLEYDLLNDLVCLPGVVTPKGINVIVFQKKIKLIRKSFDKEVAKENYYVLCQNPETISNLKDPSKETAILVRESKLYYPIVSVKKKPSQDLQITKIYTYDEVPANEQDGNLIAHIFDYYELNCQSKYKILIGDKSLQSKTARDTYAILVALNNKRSDKTYKLKGQIIDARFKCRYLVTTTDMLIPVTPSGAVPVLKILKAAQPFIQDYKQTVDFLTDLQSDTSDALKMKPIGIYYTQKREKSYVITALLTEAYETVPINEKVLLTDTVEKLGYIVQNKPDDDIVDKEIQKGPSNMVPDKRIYTVSENRYNMELYQLFRYHLSYFLNTIPAGLKAKSKIEIILGSKPKGSAVLDLKEKRTQIKELLYKISSHDLYKIFTELLKRLAASRSSDETTQARISSSLKELVEEDIDPYTEQQLTRATTPVDVNNDPTPETETFQILQDVKLEGQTDPTDPELAFSVATVAPKPILTFQQNLAPIIEGVHFPEDEKTWITTNPKRVDYLSYVHQNQRQICYARTSKDACSALPYCGWRSNKGLCTLNVNKDMLVDFINRAAEELVQNDLKASEILRRDEYFVSDIVDFDVYLEKPGEKVLSGVNVNINKILSEIFGKDNVPRIGRRQQKLDLLQNFDQLNLDHPLGSVDSWYVQQIIENNNTIYRAVANAFYWLETIAIDPQSKNLGYYSNFQKQLADSYKNDVINYLRSLVAKSDSAISSELSSISSYVKANRIKNIITKMPNQINTTNSILELFTLSKVRDCVIYVYDDNYELLFGFHPTSGMFYDKTKNKAKHIKPYKRTINLQFAYNTSDVPEKISVLFAK